MQKQYIQLTKREAGFVTININQIKYYEALNGGGSTVYFADGTFIHVSEPAASIHGFIRYGQEF